MKKLRVGFIGFGTISNIHYQALKNNKHAELVSIASLTDPKIPNIHYYENYQEMIKKEMLDVVHILTPHYLHYEMIDYCNHRGLNILVEKPVAITMQDLNALEKLKPKAKIGCVLQNRYNDTFLTLKQEVKNQKILGMRAILTWSRNDSYYNEKPWRSTFKEAGSGLLYNQAIHTIDLIQELAGPIKEITSSLSNLSLPNFEIEDSAIIKINFKNDATAIIMATNAYCDNSSVMIEVITQYFTYQIQNHELYKISSHSKELLIRDQLIHNQKIYYGPSHQILINKFYQAIINQTDDYISLQAGIPVCKTINSVLKSWNNFSFYSSNK